MEPLTLNRRKTVTPRSTAWLILAAILAYPIIAPASPETSPGVPVVENGKAAAVVIADIPSEATKRERQGIRKAVELLQFAVRQATGSELKEAPAEGGLPEGRPVILIGGGALTSAAGLADADLRVEEYRVATRGSVAVLFGGGKEVASRGARFLTYCPTSYWAVAAVITQQWRGLWLWPGADGFSIPKTTSLEIRPIDGVLRPALAARNFGLTGLATPPKSMDPGVWSRVKEETADWLRFQGIGSREPYRSPHSFSDWLEKYGETKPDLFAQPPKGESLPAGKEDRVKLRTSNPEVVRTIVAEWEAAGKPTEWGVGPNDGAFFCTAPETLALDVPPDQDARTVWSGEGRLSARYARFYQDISQAMKDVGVNVTLLGLAYGSYREAPPNPESFGVKTPVILGFIHGFDEHAKEQWLGWQKTGAELFLRPNWLHSGASAPNLATPQMVDWLNWAIDHGSKAFLFDSLLGNWGAQGLNYYALARAGQNPGMTFDAILNEYCSAFGSAAEPVRRYFLYWIDYAKKTGFPAAAGGPYVMAPDGLYARAVKDHGVPENPVAGSHWATIYLYPESVTAPAKALLEEASNTADSDETRAKVAFLQAGLEHLCLTRDTGLASLAATKDPSEENKARFEDLSNQLRSRRKELTSRHVVWGNLLETLEKRSRSPVSAPGKSYNPADDQGT